MNEVQPLRPHLHGHDGRAGEIAARVAQAGDESGVDRIATESEHDRYGGRRRLGRERRWLTARGGNHRNLTADQIGSQFRQSIVLAFCPAILDGDVLAFVIAGVAEALPKCGEDTSCLGRRSRAQKADHRSAAAPAPQAAKPPQRRAAR
jgi:hypothetical protein